MEVIEPLETSEISPVLLSHSVLQLEETLNTTT